MEKIGLWADKIVNHFWFCCEKCDQNVDDLKVKMKFYSCVYHVYKVIILQMKWIGLHHISDEHEWETGECDHEEINEQESHVPYFEKNGKDFEALQKIVLDKKWIESLKYYVRFW